mgnify:CR=1 FL=1
MHGEGTESLVSLQELQAAILSRHRLGPAGMNEDPAESQHVDDYL